MKFGICCGLDSAERALELGAEYIELGAVAFNGQQDSWDPLPFVGLPIETTNVFFPGSVKLFPPDQTPYREYAQRAIGRAAEVGVRTMVVGSGGSRKAAEGSDPLEMDARFADIVAELQSIAAPYGIAMAPESLTRLETNVGNDLGRLARLLRDRGVAYTADSFHVLKEWDFGHPGTVPPDEHWEEQIPFAPEHIHIGDLPRNFPKADDPMMIGFAKRIKALRYDGRISLECALGNLETGLPEALRQLKLLFA